MPTGYTAELMDKGQDFRTFILTCARAFGACIMQREDPMDQPPAKQAPSDYYTKAILTAQGRLQALKAMTPEQQKAEGEMLRQQAVQSAQASRVRSLAENERLDEMVAQVKAWIPPTDEHKGLKDFMLEQIKISRNDPEWSAKWLRDAEDKTAEAYFVEAVSRADHDLDYHAREHAKEVERTDGRNDWIDKLYASIPSAP